MCLVKVKQEEEVVVPYRVAQRSSHARRASHVSARHYTRSSEVVRESPRPSTSYVAGPTPRPLSIPPPQAVPVFVERPRPVAPPPSHAASSHHGGAHYVEVSPRSSVTSATSSAGHSEYVYRAREVRHERQYSPERAPRYEHFRYVEPAPSEPGHLHQTSTRVRLVDEDRRRRREYAR